SRRAFLTSNSLALSKMPLSITAAQEDRTPKIIIDPQPCFDLSPYLYMQFMEPLGTTDGYVSAAWDYLKNQWREDVIEASQNLAECVKHFETDPWRN
ncbi:MAG: alpha-L-arabinofuranosidase, partial [Candidatus Hinthialibacter sp.]